MLEAHHIVLPGHIARRAMPQVCETPAMFLARTGWPTTILPTICTINGTPVMRAEWASRMLGPDDRLAFVSRPMGVGSNAQSKQVLGLVAMIGLSMILPGVGSLLGGGLMGAIGQGAVMLGGSFLVSTLVNVKAGGDTSGSDAGTVYSFGQQRNSARILQPIAVRYGRTKAAPAYAAVPWFEYIGNDQYLNILAVIGAGRYDTEAIYVDDTLLWTKADGIASGFKGVKIEFYSPGDEITLFPLNVSTSAEVGGQELSEEWAGGFVSAPSSTTTTALAIDFAAPVGLHLVNEAGVYVTYMVNVIAQYRAVNDLGLPTGDWVQLANPLLQAASKTARRWSFKVDVPAGRYEVRVRRGKAQWDDGSNTANTIVWMGLRAFLTGPQSFQDVSTVALRLKATQQLTDTSAQNIRDISTRILPVFDGTAWVDQPTRNPAWAFWDMATNTRYGAKRAPSKVDAQAVWQLAQIADARGDRFDFEFSSAVSVPEAFDTALSAVRAKHRWSGDTLTLVRDQWQAVPSMLLTDRETVRGTFRADYEFLPSDGVDAIIGEYVDQDTWQVEEVQYPPDYVASTPRRVELRGIVQRAQAYREAGFLFRQSQYRRVSPSLETEHDGRLIALGDHVLIQSDMPGAWGAAGAVVARTGNTLTLEPPPKWESGKDHYISLRSKTGGAFGPVKCARGANDALCVLNAADLALVEANQGATLAAVLARVDGAEHPTYAHGVGQNWQRRCIALSGAPSGDRVALSFVMDDERVHDDDGVPDPLPSMPPMAVPTAPQVAGLIAQLQQNVMEPVLSASWWPAAGATLYRARVSYDGGEGWLSLPDIRGANELSAVVQPAALWLEVSAVGKSQGAWARYTLDAPVIDAGKIPVGGNTLDGVLGQVAEKMAEEVSAREALDTRLSGITAELAGAVAELDGAVDGVGAGLTVLQGAIDATAADLSSARSQLNDKIGGNTTAISTLRDAVEATAADLSSARSLIGDNVAAISTLQKTVETNEQATASRIDGVESASAAGIASAISETRATSGDLRAELDRIGWGLVTAQAAAANDTRATRATLAITTERLMVEMGTSRALMSAMAVAYADADQALAQRITSAEAAFESGVNAMNARIAAEETVRGNETGALTQRVNAQQARTDENTAAIGGVSTALANLEGSLASQISQVRASATAAQSTGNANAAAITAEQLARTEADAVNAAAITAEQAARADGATAIGNRIDGVESASAAGIASAISETRATSGDLRAELDRIGWGLVTAQAAAANDTRATRATLAITTERLMVEMGTSRALIGAMALAYADADQALAQRIATAEAAFGAGVNAVNARITAEETARANADGSLATQIGTVSAAAAAAQSKADTADEKATAATNNIATLTSQQTALANSQTAIGQRVDNAEAAIAGVSASVTVSTTVAAKPTGATAAWNVTVKGDDGQPVGAGFGVAVIDGAGSFWADVNSFHIRSGGSLLPVFVVSGSTAYIRGDLIADGSIVGRHLAVASVDVITGNFGRMRAGVLEGTNGNMIIDLDNSYIMGKG